MKKHESPSSETFRTHQEMRGVYEDLEKLPDRGHPYCITLSKPDRYFGFIGTSHTADVAHPQWVQFKEEWQKFIESTNSNKLVLYEGRSSMPTADTDEEAISRGADSGYTRWLANRAGIESVCPEPDMSQEIQELVGLGFGEDEVMTYYVGRQLAQWRRYDYRTDPDLNDYMARTVRRYMSARKWSKEFTVDEVRGLIEAYLDGNTIELAPRDLFSRIADPSENPVSSASSMVRNRSIFTELERQWASGKDVFCVYGSGHAIVLEPALRKLFEEN